jgi:hypothetical protein
MKYWWTIPVIWVVLVWVTGGCATVTAVHDAAVEAKADLHAFTTVATNGLDKLVAARLDVLQTEVVLNRVKTRYYWMLAGLIYLTIEYLKHKDGVHKTVRRFLARG